MSTRNGHRVPFPTLDQSTMIVEAPGSGPAGY
jgi:hypothetical protein